MSRRPKLFVDALAVASVVLGAAGPFLCGALAHESPWLLADRRPRYEGPGHSGVPLASGEDGQVLGFPSDGVALLSWIPLPAFEDASENANDIWAYVSPSGREYAVVGLSNGTGFVEVTDPLDPRIVAVIPDLTSLWSDMKVYGRHAYNVNEAGDGIQIIDLEGIDDGVVALSGTFTADGLWTSHNIAVNEESGFAYLAGSNLGLGGITAVDLSDPENLQIAGAWDLSYVHDVEVVSYPSGPYAGREIAFASTPGSGLVIIDVTDKSDMFTLSFLAYQDNVYTHSGWLSADRRHFFVNDELDELWDEDITTTTTRVIDVEDLENPVFVASFTNGNSAIDHNSMTRGDHLFLSNYRSGLRVYDVSDVEQMEEVGYFDTYPENDDPGFNGAWGVHAALPSGVVLISDMQRGLFVLDPSGATGGASSVPGPGARMHSGIYPNPVRSSSQIYFSLVEPARVRIRIVDAAGRILDSPVEGDYGPGIHLVRWRPDRDALASGVYFALLEAGPSRSVHRILLVR